MGELYSLNNPESEPVLRYKRKLKNFAPMMPVIKSVYRLVYHQIRLFAGKSDLYSVPMIILRPTGSVQQVYCLNIWDIRYGKVLKLCFKEHGGYRVYPVSMVILILYGFWKL